MAGRCAGDACAGWVRAHSRPGGVDPIRSNWYEMHPAYGSEAYVSQGTEAELAAMERGCAMHASLRAGRPVQVEEVETLADSLGGGIGLDNRYTFPMVRALVDDTVLVSEEEIAAAIGHAYREEQVVIEGAGAVGIAALLSARVSPTGVTAVLVSGANIDMELHRRIVCGTDATRARDPSGAGEGKRYLDATTFTADGSGSGSFNKDVPAVPSGQAITATATNLATGDTSEFSACKTSP